MRVGGVGDLGYLLMGVEIAHDFNHWPEQTPHASVLAGGVQRQKDSETRTPPPSSMRHFGGH